MDHRVASVHLVQKGVVFQQQLLIGSAAPGAGIPGGSSPSSCKLRRKTAGEMRGLPERSGGFNNHNLIIAGIKTAAPNAVNAVKCPFPKRAAIGRYDTTDLSTGHGQDWYIAYLHTVDEPHDEPTVVAYCVRMSMDISPEA